MRRGARRVSSPRATGWIPARRRTAEMAPRSAAGREAGAFGDGPEVAGRGPPAGIGGGIGEKLDLDADQSPVGRGHRPFGDVPAEVVERELTSGGRHGYRYPKADVTHSRLRTGA